MAVTMATADKALKNVYGPLSKDQINTDTSPFYNKVEQTSAYAAGGKKFIIATPVGLNGGVSFGDENGDFPKAAGQIYENFESTPKNAFGIFQITDKAWRASKNSVDAFTNLMQSEAQSLTKSVKRNLCRAMWQGGDGIMATTAAVSNSRDITITGGIQYLEVGQLVDVYQAGGSTPVANGSARRIVAVTNKPGGAYSITIDSDAAAITVETSGWITIQSSYNKEITGVPALFDSNVATLYGVTKATNPWMIPHEVDASNNLSDGTIQDVLNYMEDFPGSTIDMFYAGAGAYTAYYRYLEATKRNINTTKLAGGFSAISYGEIPIVRDRMVPNTGDMYGFETSQWKFHQLCDWEWFEGDTGDGRILRALPDKPVYQARMVKYPELICEHPGGQVLIKNCNLN